MQPIVNSARLGMVIFIAAELMFFTGLIGAYIVFRLASPLWPPPGLPHLPLGMTSVNTVILLASGYTMWAALRGVRSGSQRRLHRMLLLTAVLGTAFLAVQGFEWIRLIGHGLTLRDGTFGATFYTLIGFHALHVVGAVVWLLVVLWAAGRHRYSPERLIGVDLCGIYWFFVCGLWVVLFFLVYP
jgi:heme/copper-type cytochrome/quinol oxidase subunit 3